MTISVIVPNYNHSKYLKQRIDSILNQTCQDFELIILDDCSSDNSRAIIDEYVAGFSKITSYYNTFNSGSAFKQWDLGVQKAKGKFIWIAESDDSAEPDFLEKASAILTNNENVGLVYCNSKIIDEKRNTEYLVSDLKRNFHETKWLNDYLNIGINEISDYLYLHNTINNVSGVLFRKNKYIDAGFADHSMKYCGDWYLYIRILLISDIAYLSNPLNILRFHAGSSMHDYFRKSTYLSEVLRIHLFIDSQIKLTPKKRFAMMRLNLAIILRKLIHGQIPEFKEIKKTYKEYKIQKP
jgi:glycosyltransferase involved in cell wall biosynthesis